MTELKLEKVNKKNKWKKVGMNAISCTAALTITMSALYLIDKISKTSYFSMWIGGKYWWAKFLMILILLIGALTIKDSLGFHPNTTRILYDKDKFSFLVGNKEEEQKFEDLCKLELDNRKNPDQYCVTFYFEKNYYTVRLSKKIGNDFMRYVKNRGIEVEIFSRKK